MADAELSSARLDAIDEAVIDGYKQRRARRPFRRGKPLPVASINRELATLRRFLRLAQEWRLLDRIPRIRLLRGERNRGASPLRDLAVLMLETGVRPGEAVGLQWPDVRLQTAIHAKYGYIVVRGRKSRNAISALRRAAEMLKARKAAVKSAWTFPGETDEAAFLVSSLDHQHNEVRTALKMPTDFVIHSLRYTMLTRLGEAGADAFSIMKIAGHSSATVSQRYVHPTPEGMDRAFDRLESPNVEKFQQAEAKEATRWSVAPTKTPTGLERHSSRSPQVAVFKGSGA